MLVVILQEDIFKKVIIKVFSFNARLCTSISLLHKKLPNQGKLEAKKEVKVEKGKETGRCK